MWSHCTSCTDDSEHLSGKGRLSEESKGGHAREFASVTAYAMYLFMTLQATVRTQWEFSSSNL